MKSLNTASARQLTALSAAMAAVLYTGGASAVQRLIHSSVANSDSNNFTMLNAQAGTVGGANNVNSSWDGTVFTDTTDYVGPGSTSNFTASSITPFFGHNWTAHDIQVFAPGTYSFDTTQGGGNPESGTLTATVPTGQLGLHMLFDWNGNNNIDVFVVVAPNTVFGAGIARSTGGSTSSGANLCDLGNGVTTSGASGVANCLFDGKGFGTDGKPLGSKTWMLASIDGDADSIMGIPMAPGGPFAGFNANFNFSNLYVAGGFAPLAIDDTVTAINPNASVTINIVGNDSDIDGGGAINVATTTITLSNQTGGTAVDNGDGTITWTNTTGTTGTDSFTYTLTDVDGNISDIATVTIPVGIGAPPVANNDTLAATEDTPLTIVKAAPAGLIGNDTDAEDPATALTFDAFTFTAIGQGTIVDQGASLLYTPALNFNGPVTFTYTIRDTNNNLSNPATVTINVAPVNDPPVAQNDTGTASFNTALIIPVLSNDTDADPADVLSVTGTSNGPANGAVVINPDNTITYTPNTGYSGADQFDYSISDGNGGTATATVNITVLGQAVFIGTAVPNTPVSSEITGGSNFSMLNGSGEDVGGTNDIEVTWDGTIRTSTADPSANMTIRTAAPVPFFGFNWLANTVRIFGPGSYNFEVCPGGIIPSTIDTQANPVVATGVDGSTKCLADAATGTHPPQTLTMTVGPTQLGMHMLFDWGQTGSSSPCGLANCRIDVVEVVELNKVWAGSPSPTDTNDFGAKGALFSMAVIDDNGDGIPGHPMIDGAFVGFNPNFNLNLTPGIALPPVTAVATQGGNQVSVIRPGGGLVTVTATAPAGATFDWNSTLLNKPSDAALVTANTNGTTSQTFVFDPSGLADGAITARVTIRDPGKGNLANFAAVPMAVSSTATAASATDLDGNGIPDGQDSGLPATQIPSVAGNGTSFLLQADAGTARLGETARFIGAMTGNYGASLSATDIGTADPGATASCIGGCFDYEVTGLAAGATINVVLPLSDAIPATAKFRKFANGEWRNYSLLNGDAIASAPGGPGTCPAPGDAAYQAGLNEGDFCVQLTITDGGRNDADGTANGTIVDPGGVGSPQIQTTGGTVTAPNPESLSSGGCSLSTDPQITASQRGDWWLLAGLLGWLGFSTQRRRGR